jgi:putative copper resistance protein D
MMDISLWSVILAISKFSIYLAFSAFVGGVFIYFLHELNRNLRMLIRRYIKLASVIGIVATIVNFFGHVGSLSESGILGMFELDYIMMLLQSGVGDSLLWRLVGFSMTLIYGLFLLRPVDHRGKFGGSSIQIASYLVIIYILSNPFTFVGHVAELSSLLRVLLVIHVVLVGWWIGALWPLCRACKELNSSQLFQLMHRFGVFGIFAVTALVVVGLVLSLELVGNMSNLLTTEYGVTLSTKIAMVGGIIFLAAMHKLVLVPRLLKSSQSPARLEKSILIELGLGLAILVVASVLTTFVGPTH